MGRLGVMGIASRSFRIHNFGHQGHRKWFGSSGIESYAFTYSATLNMTYSFFIRRYSRAD